MPVQSACFGTMIYGRLADAPSSEIFVLSGLQTFPLQKVEAVVLKSVLNTFSQEYNKNFHSGTSEIYKCVLLEQVAWNVFNLVLTAVSGSSRNQVGQILFGLFRGEKVAV